MGKIIDLGGGNTGGGEATTDASLLTTGTLADSRLSSNIARTTYVDQKVAEFVDSAPETLNTLNELADALGDDPNFATTVATQIGSKAPLASPAFTGTVTGITKAMVGLTNVDDTSDATKNSATATLTNKRITKRVQYLTSTASLTPAINNYDQINISAQTQGLTINSHSGTPTDGQELVFRIKDNGTSQTVTWNAVFRAGTNIALPTSTTISKTMYVQVMWHNADAKWDLVGLTSGF